MLAHRVLSLQRNDSSAITAKLTLASSPPGAFTSSPPNDVLTFPVPSEARPRFLGSGLPVAPPIDPRWEFSPVCPTFLQKRWHSARRPVRVLPGRAQC